MDLELIRVILEALSYVVIIFGVPWAVYEYFENKRKERLEREYGTYDALDEKFLEFQNLCLQYPYLDVFDIPDEHPLKLDVKQKKEELIVFNMLFSIFERAFLMYYTHPTKIRERQWDGWEQYIREYCRRKNFRNAWKIVGGTYDTEFEKFLEKEIGKAEKEATKIKKKK